MRGRPPSAPPGGPPGGPGRSRRVTGSPPASGTLGAWLLQTALRLTDAGLPSPRTDAQRLAAWGLGIPWGDLWARLRNPLTEDEAHRLDELAARRAAAEPLAYITGSTEFFTHKIEVGPGVLVPRPETEVLVEVALELLAATPEPVVVDVGTGSGAVAVAVAARLPEATVFGTEVSDDALEYARRNASAAGVGVRLVRGDLLDALPPEMRGRVHLVVSNPPYVPKGRADLLDPDVLLEPHEALFAGPRGDEVLQRLAQDSPAWLTPGGALALEVGTPAQAETILGALEGWAERGVKDDRTGRPRVVWARR